MFSFILRLVFNPSILRISLSKANYLVSSQSSLVQSYVTHLCCHVAAIHKIQTATVECICKAWHCWHEFYSVLPLQCIDMSYADISGIQCIVTSFTAWWLKFCQSTKYQAGRVQFMKGSTWQLLHRLLNLFGTKCVVCIVKFSVVFLQCLVPTNKRKTGEFIYQKIHNAEYCCLQNCRSRQK